MEIAKVGPRSLTPRTKQMTTPTPIIPLIQYQGCMFCKVNVLLPSTIKLINREAANPIPNTRVVVAQEPVCSFTLLLNIFCKLTRAPAIRANISPNIIAFPPPYS
ncbi:hypothetical protein D3C81_1212500 [compost metagenome]